MHHGLYGTTWALGGGFFAGGALGWLLGVFVVVMTALAVAAFVRSGRTNPRAERKES